LLKDDKEETVGEVLYPYHLREDFLSHAELNFYRVLQTAVPSCPKCGAEMKRRTAKSGANKGNQFWGGSNYPQCRSIVAIN